VYLDAWRDSLGEWAMAKRALPPDADQICGQRESDSKAGRGEPKWTRVAVKVPHHE
jgi:hypothetical protein